MHITVFDVFVHCTAYNYTTSLLPWTPACVPRSLVLEWYEVSFVCVCVCVLCREVMDINNLNQSYEELTVVRKYPPPPHYDGAISYFHMWCRIQWTRWTCGLLDPLPLTNHLSSLPPLPWPRYIYTSLSSLHSPTLIHRPCSWGTPLAVAASLQLVLYQTEHTG